MINNIGYFCTTHQLILRNRDKLALRIINPDLSKADFTFADLDRESDRFANMLQQIGINPQDVVFIFLPKQAEVFFGFLGALKIQAIVGILFSNFGKEAVFDRLYDSSARVLITKISLFNKIKDLLPQLPDLQKIILTDLAEHESERILSYSKLIASSPDHFTVEETDPFTPSILHYTSGSTGKPKGVLHVHGAIEHYLRTMDEVLQVEKDDIYWCTADQAWVTGTTYGIIGPWAKGITQIHYSGNFGAKEWFQILQLEQVTVWYTAPTALRMLMQQESEIIDQFDLSRLKRVYSVGEPLNPKIIEWVKQVMNKEIYDTWFQTETGGIMISNKPGLQVKPGSMGKPLSNIQVGIFSDENEELPLHDTGSLRLKKGWASMFKAYHNMEQTYQAKFHGDYYDTGDLAKKDEDGYLWFIGRNDDVINTSGHLVGPFEVESSLLQIEGIVDVAVIGAPDEMLFEKIVAFITLKPDLEWNRSLEVKCRIHLSTHLTPVAVPSEFIITNKIPKNRSGKIMRRLLRARYLKLDEGDTSTMEE